jgi:DNA-binding LytR/AlgR family response regulator
VKVEVNVNKDTKEPKIVIYANEITEEISKLINELSEYSTNNIVGFLDNKVYLLDKMKIESFYTEGNKVYVRTITQEKYIVKYRIYELEDILQNTSFIRISNSEIANFNEVVSLDLSIIGTIMLKFKSGNTTYVSRRNITKIKKYLNI